MTTWTPNPEAKAETKGEDEIIHVRAKSLFASLNKVASMSGKYEINLCNLSDEAAEKLTAMGIKVKNKDDEYDRGNFITCTSQYEIKAFDTSGNEIHDNVGNGSEVIAKIKAYHWNNSYGKGISPSLQNLTVTNLVAYNPEGDEPGGEPLEVF